MIREARNASAVLLVTIAVTTLASLEAPAKKGSKTPLRTVVLERTVPAASQPKGVSVSPDGGTLAVTNFGRLDKKNVYLYDAQSLEKTSQVDLHGSNAVESLWSPDGSTLYVSDFRNARVLFIDPATAKVTQRVEVDEHPKWMAFSHEAGRLWVSCWGSGTVAVIDTASAERIGTVEVGTRPRGIVRSPDGSRVFVVNSGSHDIHAIDAEKMEVVDRKVLVDKSYPRHVVAGSSGRFLYVSANGKRRVYRVDAETLKIDASVFVGECPRTIGLSPDGKWLYTANFCAGSVTVVSLETLGARRVPIDGLEKPVGLAVSQDGTRIWVTSWKTHKLFELRVVDIVPKKAK